MMSIQWIEESAPWLGQEILPSGEEGVVTGNRSRAKLILTAWSKDQGVNSPVYDYGMPKDLTGPWSDRDQTMMDAFVDYWNSTHPEAPTFKQLKRDTPSKGESDALERWLTLTTTQAHPPPVFRLTPVTPGGGGAPAKGGGGGVSPVLIIGGIALVALIAIAASGGG